SRASPGIGFASSCSGLAHRAGQSLRHAQQLQDIAVRELSIGGMAEPGQHLVQAVRSEEHTSELQSRVDLVCRLLLEKKKTHIQKSSGGLAAHYHGSSWATKAKQIHDSLDDVAAKMASSNDKVK